MPTVEDILEGTRAQVTALAAALAVCSLAWLLLVVILLLSLIRARDQNQQEPK